MSRLLLLSLVCVLIAFTSGNDFQVGLVVQTPTGYITRCVNFTTSSQQEYTGLDVLEFSQIPLNIAGDSSGAGVCAINGTGCFYPQESCFCKCQATTSNIPRKATLLRGPSDCQYWSYFHLKDDQWQYAQTGPAEYMVKHGQVEGWRWDQGDQKPPKVYSFKEVCSMRAIQPRP